MKKQMQQLQWSLMSDLCKRKGHIDKQGGYRHVWGTECLGTYHGCILRLSCHCIIACSRVILPSWKTYVSDLCFVSWSWKCECHSMTWLFLDPWMNHLKKSFEWKPIFSWVKAINLPMRIWWWLVLWYDGDWFFSCSEVVEACLNMAEAKLQAGLIFNNELLYPLHCFSEFLQYGFLEKLILGGQRWFR